MNKFEAAQVYKDMRTDMRCMSPVYTLLRLLSVFLISSCGSEMLFRCLRRLKACLRPVKTQEKLNYVIIAHIHKSLLNNIDQEQIRINKLV